MAILTYKTNSSIPTGHKITGTSGTDVITVFSAVTYTDIVIDGGGGGDRISALGSGKETIIYHYNDLSYSGGNGIDILDIKDSVAKSSTIDLRGSVLHSGPIVIGFDMLDLTDGGQNTLAHTLLLDAQGVDNFTEKSNSLTHTADTMIVKAGQLDTINMGTGWTEGSHITLSGIGYHSYTQTIIDCGVKEKETLLIQNRGPMAVNDTASATENGPAIVINVLSNDTDKDPSDTKTLVSVSNTAHGGAVSIVSGQVKYDPLHAFDYLPQGATATDSFTYTMKDSFGATSTATVTVTINGINDAPVANPDPLVATTNQNTGIANLSPALLANDTDPDIPHTLSIASVSGNSHITLNSSGQVVFTPGTDFIHLDQGATQTVSFTYVAKDEFGALSAPTTASIKVTGLNDAPTAVNDGQVASTDQNTGLSVLASTFLGNDTDPDDGHVLSIASVSGDSHISLSGGNIVFTPGTDFTHLAQGAFDIVNFSYVAKDEFGALSAPATASIKVTGLNDAPTAVNDGQVATTDQNTGLTVAASTFLANDTDADDGHVLLIASVSGDPHISLDGSGNIVFTPGSDFTHLAQGDTAIVTFSYVAKDEFGALSAPATASIKVTGLNDAPTAVNDGQVASTDQNTGITVAASTVLANDTDPDDGHVLSISSVSGDSHISLNGSGNIVFTPGSDFTHLAQGDTAIVTFSYVAKDEFGALSAPATASIKVTGLNDAPTAVNDGQVATTDQNTGITVAASTFLANDTDPDEGHVLSIASVSGDPHISLDGN